MGKLLLERLLTLALKLLGMAVILFVVTQVLPADPAAVAAGTNARPEQIERIRKDLGLDRPFHEQFLGYMSGLLRGDLGNSLLTRRAVSDDLKLRFPATLELAILSGIVIVIFGHRARYRGGGEGSQRCGLSDSRLRRHRHGHSAICAGAVLAADLRQMAGYVPA